jgi:hypothetical protein
VVDDRDAVGEVIGLFEVLGREQHRDPAELELADHLPHRRATCRVEAGRRLVEEQDRWPGDEARGEVEAPAHAAGVALHHAVGRVRQIELVEQLGGASDRLAPGHAAELADHHEVLAAGERGVDGRILCGDADAPAHLGRLAHHVEAGDTGRARVGLRQRGEDAHGRRLARAVRAEHAEDRTGCRGEVDAGERLGVAEALGEADGLDGCGGHEVATPCMGAYTFTYRSYGKQIAYRSSSK